MKSSFKILLVAGVAFVGLFSFALFAPSAHAVVYVPNVLALYHLENASDTSGNGYHLTNVGSVTFVSGTLGNSATFNGSNYLWNSFDVGIAGGTITLAGWINPTALPSSAFWVLFSEYDETNDVGYNIYLNNGILSAGNSLCLQRTKNNIGDSYLNCYSVTLSTGTWYYLVFSHDASTNIGRLYVNDVLRQSGSGSGDGSGSTVEGISLSSYPNGDNYFNGKEDEFFITNTVISTSTRTALYASGAGVEVCVTAGCDGGTPTVPSIRSSSLKQLKSNGVTQINEGSSTDESTILLTAILDSASTTNSLQLQVEYTTGTLSGVVVATSSLVTSSNTATITRSNLQNASYKWQARVLDTTNNATSSWQEFGTGGNIDFIIAVPASTPVEISDGSVKALYHLENTTDSSGNGHTLTNTGTVTFPAGKVSNGNGASFNGSNQRLSNASNLGITGGDITLHAWMKPTSLPSSDFDLVFLQEDNTNDIRYAIYLDNGVLGAGNNLCFQRSKKGIGDSYLSCYATTLSTSTWYSVVMTHDGATGVGRLYLNDVLVASGNGTGNGSEANGDGVGMASYLDGARYFNGMLDEAFVANTVISTSTRNDLYNGGSGAEVCVTVGCAQQSAYFDGDDAWGYPASNVSFAATDPFTIEWWYRDPLEAPSSYFIDSRSNANEYGYALHWDNDFDFTLTCASGSINLASSTNKLNYNEWHHIAITKSSSTLESAFKLYFDGTQIQYTGSSSVPIGGNCFSTTSTDRIWFGRDANLAQDFWEGYLDEIRIWSEERSPSTILTYANQEVPVSSDNLLGYWRFNNDSRDLVTGNAPSVASGSPIFSTSSPFGHFVFTGSWYKGSVNTSNMQVKWGSSTEWGSATQYGSEFQDAINTWNATNTGLTGSVDIVYQHSTTSLDLAVYDVSSTEVTWMGIWDKDPGSPIPADIDTIRFNRYKIEVANQLNADQKKHIALHELGHALGLAHSIIGKVMYGSSAFTTYVTTLQDQDTNDYNFLWP